MARIDQVLSNEKSWGQYTVDIIGHAGLGAAFSIAPIAFVMLKLDWGFVDSMQIGVMFALFGGVVREVAQYAGSGKLHIEDRVLDVFHHVLGPPIAWILVQLTTLLFRL